MLAKPPDVLASNLYFTAFGVAVHVKRRSSLLKAAALAGESSVGAVGCSVKLRPADQTPVRPSASSRRTRQAYVPLGSAPVGDQALIFVVVFRTRLTGENSRSLFL